MKHAFLRRLGALALALAMAASLCVTPAWAEDPPPDPNDFSLSTNLLILDSDHTSRPLSILGPNLPQAGIEVEWKSDSGITLNQNADVSKVDVSYGGTGSGRYEVTATIKNTVIDKVNNLTCVVYVGSELASSPENMSLPANTSASFTATINRELSYIDLQSLFFYSLNDKIAVAAGDWVKNNDGTTATCRGTVTAGKITGYTDIYIRSNTMGDLGHWRVTVTSAVPGTAIDEIYFDPNIYHLSVGGSMTLKPNIVPSTATDKTLEWSADPSGVVEVDQNGKVTAHKPGTATITAAAKSNPNIKGTCKVIVDDIPPQLELEQTSLTLNLSNPGEQTKSITAKLSGMGSDAATVKWTASPNGYVTLNSDSGSTINVKAEKVTTSPVTVTATATFPVNGQNIQKTAQCKVTVVDGKTQLVESMTLSETTHQMPADGTFTLRVTSFSPASAPVKTVTWSSSNQNLLTVDPDTGKVTVTQGATSGEATVIATAYGGAQARCRVTVTPKADTIRLNSSAGLSSSGPSSNRYTYTFSKSGNDYISVNAILTPTTSADPIHWASKNTSVATVSSGTGNRATVTAAAPGTTTITAVPMDPAGKDRTTVIPAEITVTVSGISIAKTEGGGTPQPITSLTLAEGRRQTVTALTFGSAGGGSCDWSSSDPSIVRVGTKTGASTTLTGARPGTAVITARSGTFSGTCTVTVGEDSAVAITASTPPGSPLQFSKLVSQLQNACSSKTGSSLSYITNLAVASTDQGILHDQHHSSADTGAGVGVQDRYYPGTAPQGQRSMNDLSFVPRNTFSGTAEITYTGWSTNSKSFNGTIRVTVNGTGDVMYSSSEGAPVNFVADDFNLYHPNFRSVSFTPPQDSVGTLYYNYTSPSQPGTKVSSGTTYSRTGNPGLDRVSFVPAAGYTGTVRISYKGTDTAGRSFTGVVTITVNGGGDNGGNTADISYPMKEDSWVTFRPADFNAASQNTLGEPLSYVRFALPPSSEGTLFYNYRGFGDYDSAVASTTSYYYSGTPSLGGVSFVPTTTTPSQVDIDYTGYTIKGNTFTGTIHLGQDGSSQQGGGMRYTVFTGKSVNFSVNSFNTACIAATGASLDYVLFTQMPTVAQGSLRYTRGNSSTNNSLSTTTRCYRSAPNSWDVQLSNVYFQANANYTGTVVLPFTGYNTNGSSFTGEVTIEVTPPTAGNITYTGTTASPYRLSVYDVQSACSGALDGTLSYITFTNLPSASAGRLYSGYNGFRTGSQVNTGTRYYVSGSPSISQLSFVPRGRYNGQVAIGFTATNTSGQSVNGRIVLNLSSSGSSSYFSDLIYHTWAAPAVDYLYQNGVTRGVTATAFGPNQQINRCDFVLMLCRAFKFSEVSGYSFADVPTGSYFAGAVAAAKQRGIVSGDGANFRPYGKLTRQDAMVMIKNALDAAGWSINASSTSILNQFSDGAAVSPYARNAVSALVQLGAVNGDNGRLLPHNPITRAEAAVILHFVMTM